ncbi:hypothetical protein LguiA_033750 [Lonicera macranthoides]
MMIADLPKDVVEEFLSMLPVKSLLSCREFKAVPPLFDDYFPGLMQRELGLGFGFDEKNNDYKVVRIINIYHHTPSGGRGHTVKAEIFNLSSNSWRKLDASLPRVQFEFCFELLFNGVFHWYAQNYCDNSAYESILSFHMSTEVFKEIHFPGTCYRNKRSRLAVLNNESFALILFEDYNQAPKNFEIWVMKEYGVKESWTKQFTVGPLLGIHSPLSFGKHNELLLQRDNGQLVSCDLDTNKIRDIEVRGAPTSLGASIEDDEKTSRHVFYDINHVRSSPISIPLSLQL